MEGDAPTKEGKGSTEATILTSTASTTASTTATSTAGSSDATLSNEMQKREVRAGVALGWLRDGPLGDGSGMTAGAYGRYFFKDRG